MPNASGSLPAVEPSPAVAGLTPKRRARWVALLINLSLAGVMLVVALVLAEVVVRLPLVLATMAEGERDIAVRGESLREALADLVRQRPRLERHLFDESGALRRHVRCFHDAEYASEREGFDRRLRTGDRITILQSVSGG